MDLNSYLRGAIERQIMEDKFFQYVPARDDARTLRFLPSGELENEDEFDKWTLSFHERFKTFQINLYKDGEALLSCLLQPEGILKGRDRKDGFCLLRPPEFSSSRWKLFSHPVKFADSIVMDDREKEFRYKEPLASQKDWSAHEWDITKKLDLSILPESQTAIALVGCDRAEYFEEVIQSLSLNEEAHHLPLFVFFDLPPDEDRNLIGKQADLLYRAFPHAVVVRRPVNFGCGRNLIDVRRQLFDNAGYKRVFMFEDDMVVSSNYIKMTTKLFEWASRKYTNVGAVQGWSWCSLKGADRTALHSSAEACFDNWWGYLLCKDAWDSMKEEMYKYENLFLGGSYAERPHASIQTWLKLKSERPLREVGKNPYRLSEYERIKRSQWFSNSATGQDAVTMRLFDLHGWVRMSTSVNRGKYIGKDGIHMTSQRWKQHGYEELSFEEIPDDATRSKFDLRASFTEGTKETIKSDASGLLNAMKIQTI